MKKLFLDDVRVPLDCLIYVSNPEDYKKNDFDIVRSYDEFVEYIEKNGLPDLISFDHDLADEHYNPSNWNSYRSYVEKTGYDAAKWLVEYCIDENLDIPQILIHSMNPVGRKNIESIFQNYMKYKNKGG